MGQRLIIRNHVKGTVSNAIYYHHGAYTLDAMDNSKLLDKRYKEVFRKYPDVMDVLIHQKPDNVLLSLQGYCQEVLVVSSSLPIRKQLTKSYYWKIRHRLASLNQPALLDILVTDPDERVRCVVAQYGRKRHRDQLATDSSPAVRKVVVSFGSTHNKETILRTEQDRGVLQMIRYKGSKRQQKIAIDKLNGVYR